MLRLLLLHRYSVGRAGLFVALHRLCKNQWLWLYMLTFLMCSFLIGSVHNLATTWKIFTRYSRANSLGGRYRTIDWLLLHFCFVNSFTLWRIIQKLVIIPHFKYAFHSFFLFIYRIGRVKCHIWLSGCNVFMFTLWVGKDFIEKAHWCSLFIFSFQNLFQLSC